MRQLTPRASDFTRKTRQSVLTALVTSATLFLAPVSPGFAQNPFETIIKVNDLAITRYELQQRALMLQLFRAPGNPLTLAREQLIEDRLKIDAATRDGFVLDEDQIQAGMEEFAQRASLTTEQFVGSLGQAGVDESTYRDFVQAGLTWREYSRARFASRVSVDDDDLDRARLSISGTPGVRVLLSEIIIPAPPGQEQIVQDRANQISEVTSEAEFSSAARRFSATPSAGRGGRLDWTAITDLPEGLRGVILSLAPGEVSDPLPLQGAIALFQLRDIEELDQPEPEYEAIEYAAYYINGGRTQQNLARAAQIDAATDTCDDLYGIAKDEPPEVLERGSKAPEEIPTDVAFELAKLDPGEISTTLTRANGQTLVLLMMCGRSPKIEGEGPTVEQLTGFIRNRRLDSFANGFLEQLRAEARIIERE